MPIFWDSSDIFCDTSFSVDHSTPLIFNAWSFHHSAIRKLIILVIIPWLHLTLYPLCGPGESGNQFLTIPTSLRRNTWLMYAWSRTRCATVRSKPRIAWITDNLFVLWMWYNGERMDRYEKLSYKKKKNRENGLNMIRQNHMTMSPALRSHHLALIEVHDFFYGKENYS